MEFWKNRRVLITGHTGIKGAWLTFMLKLMGADVAGYGLDAVKPSLFRLLYPDGFSESIINDIQDTKQLRRLLSWQRPEVVFHMAAQAEMRVGYDDPLGTFQTNIFGTVALLDLLREIPEAKSILVITTDKVYRELDSNIGYAEYAELGGSDPYSCSKACADMVASTYGNVYIKNRLAIARSGNVIGGGDWSRNRLIPNCLRAIRGEHGLVLYDPDATRPWQHVIDCLRGYIMLAEALYKDKSFARAWNFGAKQSTSIKDVVDLLFAAYGKEPKYEIKASDYHEAKRLALNSNAIKNALGWEPKFDIEKAISLTAKWHQAIDNGADAAKICCMQIEENYSA